MDRDLPFVVTLGELEDLKAGKLDIKDVANEDHLFICVFPLWGTDCGRELVDIAKKKFKTVEERIEFLDDYIGRITNALEAESLDVLEHFMDIINEIIAGEIYEELGEDEE